MSSESDVGGACSFRVSDRGDDVRDTLCLKLQNKYYGPLIEWFEEVRVLLTYSVNCMLTWRWCHLVSASTARLRSWTGWMSRITVRA